MKIENTRLLLYWNEFYKKCKYRGKLPEEKLHIEIVKWIRLTYPGLLFWHTPSEGKRHVLTQLRNKLLGVRAGVPDIFIASPAEISSCGHKIRTQGCVFCFNFDEDANRPGIYCGFFCELKAGKGKLTEAQQEMLDWLKDLGYYCCVCRSLDEFKNQLEIYLGK